MELSVGSDVFALCGKCGDTWHVIVATEGSGEDTKVTKVQCKECGGLHKFRVAKMDREAAKAAKKTSKKKTTKKKTTKKKTTKKKATKIDLTALEVKVDWDVPPRGYDMRETYVMGDRVDHPKFGVGVVESTLEAGKFEIAFENGRRTLVHERR